MNVWEEADAVGRVWRRANELVERMWRVGGWDVDWEGLVIWAEKGTGMTYNHSEGRSNDDV